MTNPEPGIPSDLAVEAGVNLLHAVDVFIAEGVNVFEDDGHRCLMCDARNPVRVADHAEDCAFVALCRARAVFDAVHGEVAE